MAKKPDPFEAETDAEIVDAEIVSEDEGNAARPASEGKPAKGPLDSLADEARARAARAAVEAAAEAAVATAGKVASGVLDGLETLIFGRVGGAEEAAKADDPDPLKRIRARYEADVAAVKRAGGDTPAQAGEAAPPEAAPREAAPPRPAKEDPVARARAELEALKAARGKKPDGPVKKTL